MDTRTQRPPRTSPPSTRGARPRSGRAGRIVLGAVIVALVLSAAVLASVLYGADAETTPQPGVSAVQLERSSADDPAEPFDHEHQRLRSMNPPTAADDAQLDREVQRFRNAVDATRSG